MRVILAIIAIVIAFVVFVEYMQNKECNDKGGKMEGTGEYSTTYNMVGKVLIPNETEITKCVIKED